MVNPGSCVLTTSSHSSAHLSVCLNQTYGGVVLAVRKHVMAVTLPKKACDGKHTNLRCEPWKLGERAFWSGEVSLHHQKASLHHLAVVRCGREQENTLGESLELRCACRIELA